MPQPALTAAQKVTVLKHLINERNDEFIQAATGLTAARVSSIKRDHGYPDVEKMKWARDILSERAGALLVGSARPSAPARSETPTRAGELDER